MCLNLPLIAVGGYIEAREQHAFDNRRRDTSVHAMTSEAGPILSNTSVARSHPIGRKRKNDGIYTYVKQAGQGENDTYVYRYRQRGKRQRRRVAEGRKSQQMRAQSDK